jgi:hypothetical protein
VDSDTKPSVATEKKPKKARPGITGQMVPSAIGGAAPAGVDPNAGKRGDKKLRKGNRGTEMSEEFE